MVNVLYSTTPEKPLHSIALSGSNNHLYLFVVKPTEKISTSSSGVCEGNF